MNAIDGSTGPGRELLSILEGQARRIGMLKTQASMGALRLPSLSGVRRGSARQVRLDDLRIAALEPLAVGR